MIILWCCVCVSHRSVRFNVWRRRCSGACARRTSSAWTSCVSFCCLALLLFCTGSSRTHKGNADGRARHSAVQQCFGRLRVSSTHLSFSFSLRCTTVLLKQDRKKNENVCFKGGSHVPFVSFFLQDAVKVSAFWAQPMSYFCACFFFLSFFWRLF